MKRYERRAPDYYTRLSTKPHVVYRLYGHDDQLLYIGCTVDLDYRLYMHETAWYSNAGSMAIREHGGFVRCTSEDYPDRQSALTAERAAIRDEAPLCNRQGNPKRFRHTPAGYVPVELAS